MKTTAHTCSLMAKRQRDRSRFRLRERLNKFHGNQESLQLESISTLSKNHGLKAKPKVFDILVKEGVIKKNGKAYIITPKGFEVGGRYRENANGEKWTVWPESVLLPYIMNLKKLYINALPFEYFFHITHLSNLEGILASGIQPHNNPSQRTDISDGDVQLRRSKEDSVFKSPIHNYTPLYLNPRNAMLYRVQKEFGDSIVVLRVYKQVLEYNKFVFTDKNAAADKVTFSNDLEELAGLDWSPVFQRSWSVDGISNLDIKSKMMAECLIANAIDASYIDSISCLTKSALDKAAAIVHSDSQSTAKLLVDQSIFFCLAARNN